MRNVGEKLIEMWAIKPDWCYQHLGHAKHLRALTEHTPYTGALTRWLWKTWLMGWWALALAADQRPNKSQQWKGNSPVLGVCLRAGIWCESWRGIGGGEQKSQLGFPGADILLLTSTASSDGQHGRLRRLIGQRNLFLCRIWNMQKRNASHLPTSWVG